MSFLSWIGKEEISLNYITITGGYARKCQRGIKINLYANKARNFFN
jgi:hypothetical protein